LNITLKLFLFSILISTSSLSFAVDNGTWIYDINEDGTSITLAGCSGPCPSEIVVPEYIDNKVVTDIHDWAFYKEGISSLSLNDSLKTIGMGAFQKNDIEELTLNENLSEINARAFAGNKLKNLQLPSKLTRVGQFSFEDNQLTSLIIPEGFNGFFEHGAIFKGNKIKDIIFPESFNPANYTKWSLWGQFASNPLKGVIRFKGPYHSEFYELTISNWGSGRSYIGNITYCSSKNGWLEKLDELRNESWFEEDMLMDDCDGDLDNDGISDEDEILSGSNPYLDETDTDGDLLPDYWELRYGLNPSDPEDAKLDVDFDGLSYAEEFTIKTDFSDKDTDGDSLPDGWEYNNGRNPKVPDYGIFSEQQLTIVNNIVMSFNDDTGEWVTKDWFEQAQNEDPPFEIKHIAYGDNAWCISSDTDIKCGGYTFAPPVSGGTIQSLGVGCAVISGQLRCWNANPDYYIYLPQNVARARVIDRFSNTSTTNQGTGTICAFADDMPVCWDYICNQLSKECIPKNYEGFNDWEVGTETKIKQVIAEESINCIVRDYNLSKEESRKSISCYNIDAYPTVFCDPYAGGQLCDGYRIGDRWGQDYPISPGGVSNIRNPSIRKRDAWIVTKDGQLFVNGEYPPNSGYAHLGGIKWPGMYEAIAEFSGINDVANVFRIGDYSRCVLSLSHGFECIEFNNATTGLQGRLDKLMIDPDGDGVSNQGGKDVFPLDSSEWSDSDTDGTGDNSDAFPDNPLYSLDSDSDGMPDAWETRYGLDPNDPSDATSDQDNDGITALDEFLAGTIPSGSLDIDGNEDYDALTDGLLLLRGMFGLDGSALVTGTIASDAAYTESVDIESRIETLGDLADIDGNGDIDALTDGLLTLRYLFGLEGDTLINGVVASDATRKTAEEIEAHIDTLMPSL
jgi:hypothetical protein